MNVLIRMRYLHGSDENRIIDTTKLRVTAAYLADMFEGQSDEFDASWSDCFVEAMIEQLYAAQIVLPCQVDREITIRFNG